jgi:tRNA pseudouridine32 synthase/23S rRNA pseudouridine746 synthase
MLVSETSTRLHALPELSVVYHDETLLVLDKPSGLLSVPGKGPDKQDCLSERARAHFPQARVVHRLDMGTSGLMLMALDATSQRQLNDTFAKRAVYKYYEAIVSGVPDNGDADGDGWSLIDLPISIDWPRRPLRTINQLQGKPSLTRWKQLKAHGDYSHLALEPLTGRSHQLRVHLQAIGHPIWGDALYAPAEVVQGAPRLLLHACKLGIAHPQSGQQMAFVSDSGFERFTPA